MQEQVKGCLFCPLRDSCPDALTDVSEWCGLMQDKNEVDNDN